jgi:threonyl-tRNA synthetase
MVSARLSVIPVNTESHGEYAKNIFTKLKDHTFANSFGGQEKFRVDLEDGKDGLGKKVRYAKEMKYPYWIVIGDKEIAENKVTLESRSGEKFSLTIDELLEKLEKEIEGKK